MVDREKKIQKAKEAAEFLRTGYFMRTGYVSLDRTSYFSESELQSQLSKRLHKLANDSALADYFTVADYIDENPLDYADYYERAYHRREEGYLHAVRFRRLAIHSPAQRRKSQTAACTGSDISKAYYSPHYIRMLEISEQQILEFERAWKTYSSMDTTEAEKSKWIRKTRSGIYTPEQHAVWIRMAEENGPAPEPPNLDSLEMATELELVQFSPVFEAVGTQSSFHLSDGQQESFSEFSEVVRTGIHWMKQFEYPEMFFPHDPSFDSDDPMQKTIETAMFHADQYLLLKILTPEQYDQLVPEVIGKREEFTYRKRN